MNKKRLIIGAFIAIVVYASVWFLIKSFADPTHVFWLTAYNMRLKNGYDYTAFDLFGPLHLAELGLGLVTSVIGYNLFKRASAESKQRTLVILSVMILCEEILKDIVIIATGQFQYDHLPFHLCGVNIFIALWFAIRPNDYLAEYLYAIGLPGTWVALITTSWQACPIYNFNHIHSVIFHIMLAVFCILVLAGGFRPHIWHIYRVFIVLLGTCIPAIICNALFDTNFFFLKRTENNPILEAISTLCGRFYLLGLGALAIVFVLFMYIPWIITDIIKCIKKRKA
ncbi:MAG: YwaF family protein [Lachnospiraceae bacterium]|nr:YwaF family protein [Lachnospiraceae bacterium]